MNNTTIQVKRVVTTDGKDTYGSVILSLGAYIEPIEPEAHGGFQDESVYLDHKCWVDNIQDIQRSDLITDSDDNEYVVRGVQKFKGGDVPDHTEIIMTKKC